MVKIRVLPQPKKTYAIVSNMLGMSLEGNAFEMEKGT